MKTYHYLALLLIGTVTMPLTANAARISEPGTVFYGRVFTRVGNREFPVTEGALKWTVSNPAQGGREYQLATTLEPLGDSSLSYRLTVPHQVLAYDLTVSGGAVPLTAAGTRLRHGQITVGGLNAVIVTPAVDGFTAQQSARAATYRVDLEVPGLSVDSDGDGLPDWWEDAHGLDKWNPADKPSTGVVGSPNTNNSEDDSMTTFAKWREKHFPGSAGDLNKFAQEDPDHDGLPNLIEYAFQMDPWNGNQDSAKALPRADLLNGKFALIFRKNLAATDLDYVIEASEDLISWTSATSGIAQTELAEDEEGPGAFSVQDQTSEANRRFLRVRVNLKP